MNRRKQNNTKIISFFLLVTGYWLAVTFLLGCATVPTAKVGEPAIQKFYINNTVYYPLLGLCSHYAISWDYDSIGRQISLKKSDSEIKLLIDSSMILVNSHPLDIKYPIVIYNGSVAVPSKFKEIVLDKLYRQARPLNKQEYAGYKRIKRVVVDAGHGGRDPGAVGRTGLREKDVNLDLAKRLAGILERQGIEVVMTRKVDKFISLQERVEIANRVNADFFISIHSNSARSRKLNGFEVYYLTDKADDSLRALSAAKNNIDLNIEEGSFYKKSLELKATLWDMLYTQNRWESILMAQAIAQAASRNMGLRILGVKGASFFVLKGNSIPAVLIEVGFLSNQLEEKYLRNGFYRQQIAEALADGIADYNRRYKLAWNMFD